MVSAFTDKEHPTWADIEEMVTRLVRVLPRDFDALLVVTRGGMVPACLISETIDLRNILVAAVMFYTGQGSGTLDRPVFLQFPNDPLLAGKRILVVDDVWDSGRTIMAVKERVLAAGGAPTLAVLHYKPKRSHYSFGPDYYAAETDSWIVYPWAPKEQGEVERKAGPL